MDFFDVNSQKLPGMIKLKIIIDSLHSNGKLYFNFCKNYE